MDFKYCPKCAGELSEGGGNLSGVPICKKCGFKFFQNPRPTVTAIMTNESGEILLVKRALEPKKGTWALVGGFLEIGEEAVDGLKREVKEELGPEITNIKFLESFVNKYLHDPSIKNATTLDMFFTCRLNGQPEIVDKEVAEIKWFKKEEIPWDEIAFESNKKALRKYIEGN